MINIYLGEENLPKGLKVIMNPDEVFLAVVVSGTPFQRFIIHEIDKGEYVSNTYFRDRFGVNLYHSYLSTGSKALIEAEYFRDRVICFDGVGNNALKYITRLSDCHIYFSKRGRALPLETETVPVMFNGELYSHICDLNAMYF